MIVLDTHVLIWWLDDPSKLSTRARRAIRRSAADGSVIVSAISLFEISTLLRRGRLQLAVEGRQWFAALTSLPELRIEPVTADIAWLGGADDDHLPGDPADRIIAATAHALSCKLVTADRKLRSAGFVEVVW